VTIISRVSSTVVFPADSTVIRVNDFSDENELATAFKGQDAVINCISYAGNHGQESIIDAVVRAGVHRYIPSDFASNAENAVALELQPRLARNVEIVSYLRSKEADGLTWSSIVTGFFFDMYVAFETFYTLATLHSTCPLT
jgi:NmrA-like family